MSETNDRMDTKGAGLPTPWQVLLDEVEHDARRVAEEIMFDSVLADSITMGISAYLTQRDKLLGLRKEFAEADTFCANLRSEAKELMNSLGYDFEWDQEDISAVDTQLMVSMKEAGEKAAAINKLRSEANALENQLLARLIDEIALCASIVVLRQMDQYSCEGAAFCVAYIATFVLREKTIEDIPLSKALATLSDWLQYSIGVKKRVVELDIYAHNHVAEGIGKGMGINSSSLLRLALIDAMKKSIRR
jgi:hypothetical protein